MFVYFSYFAAMSISADIEFLPADKKYRLLLPGPVTQLLDLKNADGKTLIMTHENKMQLEWLAQKIYGRFNTAKELLISIKTRLKRKKRLVLILLGLAAVAGFLNKEIASLSQLNSLYIKVSAFAIGIICCLQLLKYYAQGISSIELASFDPEISELKELILKDYSI
jgi:hypothetical protein